MSQCLYPVEISPELYHLVSMCHITRDGKAFVDMIARYPERIASDCKQFLLENESILDSHEELMPYVIHDD